MSFRVLLVEDNPADADLAKELLEDAKLRVELHIESSGDAALRYLETARPELILLDLNLPGLSGQEVLKVLKSDPRLRRIPVVVLTSSGAERDIAESYDLGANCYVTKPVDLAQFEVIVRSIEQFWFTIVKLPAE